MTASRSRAKRSLNSGHGEPGGADGDLVERLARADAEDDAPGVERAEGAEGLGDDRRVVAEGRGHDGRAEHDALGALARRRQPRHREGSVAALVAPRLEVVGDEDRVQTALLGLHGIRDEVARAELLR